MTPKIQNEYKLLCDNQINRQQTYKLYKDFIDNLDTGTVQKKYRQWLKNTLVSISKAKIDNDLVEEYTLQDLLENKVKPFFDSIEEEYQIIYKFGHGLWDKHFIQTGFNSADQRILILIAKGYGAFDYL
jgi:hypothetical protein